MSKSNRKEIAKRLKQEIETCTDPNQLIKLSNAYDKVAPKRAKRARRKPVTSAPPTAKYGRLSKRTHTGTAVDQLSDAQWLVHDMAAQIEVKCRARGLEWDALTRPEKDALLEEVTATLSAEECAAVEALNKAKVA